MGPGLTQPWAVEERFGRAVDLFSAESWATVDSPTVRVLKVSAPTIVVGSSQPQDVVDLGLCRVEGVDVARRRSGGGAVWLDDGMIWVDVFVPAGHHRWDADIGRSMWWLGDAWATSLISSGIPEAVVHRDAVVHTKWSSLVCFAGLGAGEVTVDGRKVVGISQRRTRAGALLQCGLLRRWEPTSFLRFLRVVEHSEAEVIAPALAAVGLGIGETADRAFEAFLGHLATDDGSITPNLSVR